MKKELIIPGFLAVAIFAAVFSSGILYNKVEATEEDVTELEIDVEENRDNVQELAYTVDKFITVQTIANDHLGEMVQELRKGR